MAKPFEQVMFYDPELRDTATNWVLEDPVKRASFAIGTLAYLEGAVQEFHDVKLLIVNTHGTPGYIFLGDKTPLLAGQFATIAAKNPKLLSIDAEILFLGCNVGEGIPGEVFLDGIATALLQGKGGTVAAATSATYDTGADYGVLPPWGKLKKYRYSSTGKRIGVAFKGSLSP